MKIEEIAAVYAKRLYRIIIRQCSDAELAKDILQETLLQAHRHCSKGLYKEEGKLWGWLQSIAQNLLVGHYREQGRRREAIKDHHGLICENLGWKAQAPVEIGTEPESSQARVQRIGEHLGGFIQARFHGLQITEKERKVLVQRYQKQKAFQDMADDAGESLSTVLCRHNAAILKMRSQLLTLDAAGAFAPGGVLEDIDNLTFEQGDRKARRRAMDKLWPMEPPGRKSSRFCRHRPSARPRSLPAD